MSQLGQHFHPETSIKETNSYLLKDDSIIDEEPKDRTSSDQSRTLDISPFNNPKTGPSMLVNNYEVEEEIIFKSDMEDEISPSSERRREEFKNSIAEKVANSRKIVNTLILPKVGSEPSLLFFHRLSIVLFRSLKESKGTINAHRYIYVQIQARSVLYNGLLFIAVSSHVVFLE
eukprot:TRINITY_DN1167_c0_g1_i5.p1 TRINITY_DN1167_c0_g1~~TRINITY_DN1167_c0_g1_i5.p1  ORF type:complete len:174 (+),score=19.24 TRINITY_DN1167_c0_g1_i5:182-703(+)